MYIFLQSSWYLVLTKNLFLWKLYILYTYIVYTYINCVSIIVGNNFKSIVSH